MKSHGRYRRENDTIQARQGHMASFSDPHSLTLSLGFGCDAKALSVICPHIVAVGGRGKGRVL